MFEEPVLTWSTPSSFFTHSWDNTAGIGRMLVDAILKRDILLVQGGVVLVAVAAIIALVVTAIGPGIASPDTVLLPLVAGLLIVAMLVSTLHLGRPVRAVRSLSNLRSSWLSREILLALLLLGNLMLAWLTGWRAAIWLLPATAIAYVGGMALVYRQRTVPVWNTWRTPASFFFSAILLGGSVIGDEALIAAGAVVKEGFEVPPRSLVAGVPGVVKKTLEGSAVDRGADGGRHGRFRTRRGTRGPGPRVWPSGRRGRLRTGGRNGRSRGSGLCRRL